MEGKVLRPSFLTGKSSLLFSSFPPSLCPTPILATFYTTLYVGGPSSSLGGPLVFSLHPHFIMRLLAACLPQEGQQPFTWSALEVAHG